MRWYDHGWNRPLSWELILRITPRLPRVLLLPLQHVTTLVCLFCMGSERAAARRNLARVTGAAGLANLRLVYRLFYNFSRFMVAYGEMRELPPDALRARVIGAEAAERSIRGLLQEGRGIVLATMHIGQWDLGLKLLAGFDVPVHVVMLRDDPREVARYAEQARAWPRLEVHPMGGSPFVAMELMAALNRGEVVAVQIDRPVGGNVMHTTLFGAETELPTGPVQLAMATGAPLLPVFVLFDSPPRYRLVVLPELRFARQRGEQSAPALREAMGRMTEVMESVVARSPDQWFNFYDVWPQPAGKDFRG